ncbi:extracellular solute-binding protein family 1 [Mycolicibacterium rhodesiae JS60]|nr:extracellular solute-binding protein family 1 [Mycolicibacterium rhodesiae JS60]
MRKSTIVATLAGALTAVGLGMAGVAEASDAAPSCPTAYECFQDGPDPQVPYGTDSSVPYGVGNWNSPVPRGRGSSPYSGGAY